MIDTLKTTATGMGGFWISMMEWVPEFVSLLVGMATLMYLLIKISNEIKEKR